MEQWRRWAPLAVLAALCVLVSLFNPNFLTVGNFVRLLNSAAIPVVLCMGATFIILMGSIDLSVEGVVAMTAVVASLLVANDITSYSIGLAAAPVAILIGGAMGFLNGFVHVRLKTPSFMTTLGIGFAGLGIATAVLGGLTVRIADPVFRSLSLGRFLGIPMAVWIALAAFLVALTIQQRTRIGRWIYAIGTDEVTARHAGIPVDRTRILAFVLAGLFYGLGGVLAAAQFGQGHALISQGRLFTTITAVVVGGTALSGGVGSVVNSVIGVFIVVVLANGMVLMGIEPYVQQGVQGLLIIAAVSLALDRSSLAVVK
ncbi:MAG: ABC transporter permease [Rhizobiales bacterium]|nr:ABC transporter permease [Hyphomicrobiales bacterium]